MSPARVLAIDDSPDNLLLLEALLEDLDEYQLICVDSGSKALQSIEQSPPDLILLDVMMPEMDGYEVTEKIRNNKNLPFIPILLLTAHEQSSVVTGLDMGADDFIRKPFQLDELLARMRALIRLKHSIDAQQHMQRQRDDFVARMTHDLRTPLIAANRMLNFCLKGSFGQSLPDMEEALTNIVHSNDNLLQMVNSLLEVYRHEAGRKQLTLSTVDLLPLCQEVQQTLQPLADEKELRFTIATRDPQAPYTIMGDQLELRRVLMNLVGNAIKFTESGAVTLSLAHQGAPPCQHVGVTVQDTGPGIPPAELDTIFEWFRQGTHRKAGSGLGLHLAHRIVALHQGQLTVDSQVGQGSTFSLSLPCQPPDSLHGVDVAVSSSSPVRPHP